jgi:hypothetical protein
MIYNGANYPELATDMVASGAKAIFAPSNNGLRPEKANVEVLSRSVDIARARDNEVTISGRCCRPHGGSGSRSVRPLLSMLAERSSEQERR